MCIGVPAKDARFAWTFDNLPSSEISSFHTSRGKIKSTFVSSEHNDQSSRLRNGTPKDHVDGRYRCRLQASYLSCLLSSPRPPLRRFIRQPHWYIELRLFSIDMTSAFAVRPVSLQADPRFSRRTPPPPQAPRPSLNVCCHLDKKKRDGRVTCSSLDPEIPLATNTISSSGLVF
ncbi:hypothetical protein ARMGADRAFT_1034735 [Armillaria gallica]|uniref:Uncharacterized protein n=1 Tax=Armillaria gallica TaxID=47427 RepID=A0A2H3D1B2_ARMGA|nr:hypothetical protein ARMGADRAFT_1034735 [Armillaria gallica]